MGRHKTCRYIGWIFCRGNPRGCPIVGRFSKIDSAVSRYESRPTQAQQTDNYPGGLEHKERRSPFPTNDSILCPGRGFRREQRSLFPTTTAKCQHALAISVLVVTSHSRMVPSHAPEARVFPSGENDTETTCLLCLRVVIF